MSNLLKTKYWQFMQEVRRRKRHQKTIPSSVDGFSDSQDIANQFASKYNDLYNSSESNKRSIDDMWDMINHDVISGKNVAYTSNNIQDAIDYPKNGNHDGVYDLITYKMLLIIPRMAITMVFMI